MLRWPQEFPHFDERHDPRPAPSLGPSLVRAAADEASEQSAPALAVVIPTFNERGNIGELVARLQVSLAGFSWEAVFVDDDSPDGTAAEVAAWSQRDTRIRLLHRIGRRGLSSACIEGMLATTAPYIAVMDADLQHDETILPAMLRRAEVGSLDIVVGTRHAAGGSVGRFCRKRQWLSRFGQQLSHCVCCTEVSDPMSGFFVVSRAFLMAHVHELYGGGFKILLDLLSCSDGSVRLAEVGYTFQLRRRGESKLDTNTAVEYLFLVLHKLTRGRLPSRFAAFSLVGTAGVVTHLLLVTVLLHRMHETFLFAQVTATYGAMTENFFLNNLITWRDRKLRGLGLVTGLLSFWVVCSFGAWANVVFARGLLQSGVTWYMAAFAGIVVSSVWNYSMANLFTWQRAQPHGTKAMEPEQQRAYEPNALL